MLTVDETSKWSSQLRKKKKKDSPLTKLMATRGQYNQRHVWISALAVAPLLVFVSWLLHCIQELYILSLTFVLVVNYDYGWNILIIWTPHHHILCLWFFFEAVTILSTKLRKIIFRREIWTLEPYSVCRKTMKQYQRHNGKTPSEVSCVMTVDNHKLHSVVICSPRSGKGCFSETLCGPLGI